MTAAPKNMDSKKTANAAGIGSKDGLSVRFSKTNRHQKILNALRNGYTVFAYPKQGMAFVSPPGYLQNGKAFEVRRSTLIEMEYNGWLQSKTKYIETTEGDTQWLLPDNS